MNYVLINEKNEVVTIFYKMEFVPEELRDEVIEVEVAPIVEPRFGENGYLVYTGGPELELQYRARPLTQEEKIDDIGRQQQLMQEALDEIIFGGGF